MLKGIQEMTIAHQHTRCIIALTLAYASMEVLTPALANTPLQRNEQRVNRWLGECKESLPKRKLSAGARRDIESAISKLAPHAETSMLSGDEILAAWTANLRAAHTLVVDRLITCKGITSATCWTWLECTMETLCKALEQLSPEAEERGTDIYMEVA